MKRSKIFRIFSIAVILSLVALAVPALPTFAATTSLSPTSGKIGDSVTVTGLDFTTYASGGDFEYYAQIYFAKDDVALNSNIDTNIRTYQWVETYVFIDEQGDFDASFVVPTRLDGYTGTTYDADVTSGTYYVYTTITRINLLTDEEVNYSVKGKSTFTVTAAGTLNPLSPTSGSAGTTVTVSGSGFLPNSPVVIRFGSGTTNLSPTIATNGTGSFSGTITIPADAIPSTTPYNIIVATGTTTKTATFTVTASATVSLSAISGPAGSAVSISGSGFLPNSPVVARFGSGTTNLSPTLATDGTGSFSGTITIPSDAIPSTTPYNIIMATGTTTKTATFTVTASAALTLSPTSGGPGTTVVVTGTNFPPSTHIDIMFDTNPLTPTGSSQTDVNGSFTSVILIPSTATSEDHTIYVTVGLVQKTATFTVSGGPPPTTPPPTTPPPGSAILSPLSTSGDFIGAKLGLTGAGFTPGANVSFKYDDIVVATVIADADGWVKNVFFDVPPSMHGEHTITVSDGTNTGTTTYTVESEAPSAPPPLLPEDGQKAESPITFDWTDVADDSAPVTYDFQIATDEDFTADSLVLEETGLEESQFVYEEMEELKLATQEDPYFWRVKAVDAAFNDSDWSDTGEFFISPPFSFPKWALYLIIGVAAVFLFVIGFWIGRRTAFYY